MVTINTQKRLSVLKMSLLNLPIHLQPGSAYRDNHCFNDYPDTAEKNIISLADDNGNFPNLDDLKNAFNTWYGFENEARYGLLKSFDCEIEKLRPGLTYNEKTIIFCRMFLHEFVGAITTMTT